MYSVQSESFTKGKVVDRAAVIYYSQVDSAQTKALAEQVVSLTEQLPEGWNGLTCADPDGSQYLIVANLAGSQTKAEVKDLTSEYGAPVLSSETYIVDDKASATISLNENHSLMQPLKVFIKGSGIVAKGFNPWDDLQISVRTLSDNTETITITAFINGTVITTTQSVSGTTIIRLDGDSPTGLNEFKSATTPKDATLYDLSGRLIAHGKRPDHRLQHGIYIRNGKKVLQ